MLEGIEGEWEVIRRLTFGKFSEAGRFFYIYGWDDNDRHSILLAIFNLMIKQVDEDNYTTHLVCRAISDNPKAFAVKDFLFQHGDDYTKIEDVL